MSKKTDKYLVQVTYQTDKYEYGLFYLLDIKQIGYMNNRIFILDGDVEFVDGKDNVEIHLYDDYTIEIIEHDERNLLIDIKANRNHFKVFKPLQVIREQGTTYNYYYRIKKGDV